MVGLTASYYGASGLNHCKLQKILKEDGKIIGAMAFDKVSGEEFNIKTRVILNTTGPLADETRHLSEKDDKNILMQGSGTHIVVSKEFRSKNMGFVDPNTQDGRLAFLLPYKGRFLMGATDIKCNAQLYMTPKKEDLEFLMHEIDFYMDRHIGIRKEDVMSVWTGIRPLIKDINKSSTEKIVHKHCINIDNDGLVTLSGGKWTIYRLMAEQTIYNTISKFKLKPLRPCLTRGIKLIGGQNYSKKTIIDIKDTLNVPDDIAEHLATSYGTRALLIKKFILKGYHRLAEDLPYIEEEVIYQMEYELAVKISDVLFNRLSISYIDVRTASELVEIVGLIRKDI